MNISSGSAAEMKKRLGGLRREKGPAPGNKASYHPEF
jgi:hypothetical protein